MCTPAVGNERAIIDSYASCRSLACPEASQRCSVWRQSHSISDSGARSTECSESQTRDFSAYPDNIMTTYIGSYSEVMWLGSALCQAVQSSEVVSCGRNWDDAQHAVHDIHASCSLLLFVSERARIYAVLHLLRQRAPFMRCKIALRWCKSSSASADAGSDTSSASRVYSDCQVTVRKHRGYCHSAHVGRCCSWRCRLDKPLAQAEVHLLSKCRPRGMLRQCHAL